MNSKIKVSVFCIVYNHKKYIHECLDGFVKQKTTFQFEVIVHDDCSTDGSDEIIKEYQKKYPSIIKPILQHENQYSKGIRSIMATFMLPKASGEYITICEGDDYWTDENKLQMQVDFLEKNQDIGLVYTYANVFYQEEKRIAKNTIGEPFVSYEDVFINGNCIPTLTLCMRTSLYKKYLEEINPAEKNWKMGDLPICLWFIKNSKIHLIPKVTSMYRVLSESASHSNDPQKMAAFNQSIYDIREYFAQKYDDMELLHQFDINNKINIAWKERNRDEFLSLYKEFKYPKKILKIKYLIFRNTLLYKLFILLKK